MDIVNKPVQDINDSELATSAQVPTNPTLKSGVLTINGVGDFDANKFSSFINSNSSALVNTMKMDPKLAPYLKRKLESLAASIANNGGIIDQNNLNVVLPEAITGAEGYSDEDITKYATNLLILEAAKFSQSPNSKITSKELILNIQLAYGDLAVKKSFIEWYGKPSTSIQDEFRYQAALMNVPNSLAFFQTYTTHDDRKKAMSEILNRVKSRVSDSSYMDLVHFKPHSNYDANLSALWLGETADKLLESGAYATEEDVKKLVTDVRLRTGINLTPWIATPLSSDIAALEAAEAETKRRANTPDPDKEKRLVKPGTEETATLIDPGTDLSWAEVTMMDGSTKYAKIDLNGDIVDDKLYSLKQILKSTEGSNSSETPSDEGEVGSNLTYVELENNKYVSDPTQTKLGSLIEALIKARYVIGEEPQFFRNSEDTAVYLSGASYDAEEYSPTSLLAERLGKIADMENKIIYRDRKSGAISMIDADTFDIETYKKLGNVSYIYMPKHIYSYLRQEVEDYDETPETTVFSPSNFQAYAANDTSWGSDYSLDYLGVPIPIITKNNGKYELTDIGWSNPNAKYKSVDPEFAEQFLPTKMLDTLTRSGYHDAVVKYIKELVELGRFNVSYNKAMGTYQAVIGSNAYSGTGYNNLPLKQGIFKFRFGILPGTDLKTLVFAPYRYEILENPEMYKDGGKIPKYVPATPDYSFANLPILVIQTGGEKAALFLPDLVLDDVEKAVYRDELNKLKLDPNTTLKRTNDSWMRVAADVTDTAALGTSFIPGFGMIVSSVLGAAGGVLRSINEINTKKDNGELVGIGDWLKTLGKNVGIGLAASNVVGRSIKALRVAAAGGSKAAKLTSKGLLAGMGLHYMFNVPKALQGGILATKSMTTGNNTSFSDWSSDIASLASAIATVSPQAFANRAVNRVGSKNLVERHVGTAGSGKLTDPKFINDAIGRKTRSKNFFNWYAEKGERISQKSAGKYLPANEKHYTSEELGDLFNKRLEFIPLEGSKVNSGISGKSRFRGIFRQLGLAVELNSGKLRIHDPGKIQVYYTGSGDLKLFYLQNTDVGNLALDRKKIYLLNKNDLLTQAFKNHEAGLIASLKPIPVSSNNPIPVVSSNLRLLTIRELRRRESPKKSGGGRINNILKLEAGGPAASSTGGGGATLWGISLGKLTGESMADRKRKEVYQSGSTSPANLGLNTANTREKVLQYRKDNFINPSGDIFWNNLKSNLEKYALDGDTKEVIKDKIIEYASSYNTLQDNFNFIQKNFVDENGNMLYGTFDGDTPDNAELSLIYKHQLDFNTLFGDADRTLRGETHKVLSKSAFPHGEGNSANGTVPGYDHMFGLTTANRYGDVDASKIKAYNDELKKYGVQLIDLSDSETAAKFPEFNADGGARHRLVGIGEDGELYSLSSKPTKAPETTDDAPSDSKPTPNNPTPNNPQNPGNLESKTIEGEPLKDITRKMWVSRKLPLDIASTFMAFHQPKLEEYSATSLSPYRLKSHLLDNNPLLKHFQSQAATTLTASNKPVTSDASLQAGMMYQGNVEANKLNTLGALSTKEYYDKSMLLIKATEDNNVAVANLMSNLNVVSLVEADNTNRLVRNQRTQARYQNMMNWLRQRVAEENAYDTDKARYASDAYIRHAANLNDLDMEDFRVKYSPFASDYANLQSNKDEVNRLVNSLRDAGQLGNLTDASGNINREALNNAITKTVRYTDATKTKFDTLDKAEEAYWGSLVKLKSLTDSIDKGNQYSTNWDNLNARMQSRNLDSTKFYGRLFDRVKRGYGYNIPNYLR